MHHRHRRRLLKRLEPAYALKEGAHEGTRGSLVLFGELDRARFADDRDLDLAGILELGLDVACDLV